MIDDPRDILRAARIRYPDELSEWLRVDAMLPSDGRGLYPKSCTAAILALSNEVAALAWSLNYLLDHARAVDLYYDVPEAKLGDVEDAKRCLRARWEKAR